MTPTEEEKQRIQEAQLANPDVPLGTAEQFLFSLASISALTPRLQLWAFKLNYEALEKVSLSPTLTHYTSLPRYGLQVFIKARYTLAIIPFLYLLY